MLLVISPAKALDYETPPVTTRYSQPNFLDEAGQLVAILRKFAPHELAGLMNLSDALAVLNVARYAAWSRPFTLENAKQAVLAFNGDVYEGLDAATLNDDELDWAQQRLRILSGLYGVLRPLDLMQAYRLEMSSRLVNPRGRNLYAWWGDLITGALRAMLAGQREAGELPVLVNLASGEYFKSVQTGKLGARVVTPVFEDWKDGRYKIISFYAKRARGLMCRHAIQQRAMNVEALKRFDAEGYAFAEAASDDDTLVFRRRQE